MTTRVRCVTWRDGHTCKGIDLAPSNNKYSTTLIKQIPCCTLLMMPHCIRIFHLIRPAPFQLCRNVTVQKCLWDQHGLEVLVIKKIRSAFASGGNPRQNM